MTKERAHSEYIKEKKKNDQNILEGMWCPILILLQSRNNEMTNGEHLVHLKHVQKI